MGAITVRGSILCAVLCAWGCNGVVECPEGDCASDGGPADAQPDPLDAADPPPLDGGPPADAGPEPDDAGRPMRDAGPEPQDAGPLAPDAACTEPPAWYRDSDGDGQGDPSTRTDSCDPVPGFVRDSRDCDDACARCHAGAAETCDGRDEDCDGVVDEGVTTAYHRDADGDGRGDPSRRTEACSAPAGHVDNADDCDDGCAVCWSGASESCDARDNDCDGRVDEGATTTYYLDADRDGRGDPSRRTEACSAPTGYVDNADDCDDGCAVCWNGASESCDARDNDCDGRVDEGVLIRFHRDGDRDGHGDPAISVEGCTMPTGFVAAGDDCDDACAACHPGGRETCDERDNDCDATVDEGVTTTYYRDADGDGYGVSSDTRAACSAPAGYSARGGDCNDASAAYHPGATEVCNAVDDDCDGRPDDTFPCVRGATVSCTASCGTTGSGTCSATCALPSGSSCTPPAETCNHSDDDCDGVADENLFRAGPVTQHAYGSDFSRPTTVGSGLYLYSFWVAAGTLHAWRLTTAGELTTPATSQVPLGGSANYDVDGNASGIALAHVDSGGNVVLRRLDGSLGTVWTRTIVASVQHVQLAVGRTHVFVFTREGAGRIYRRVHELATGAPVGSPELVGQSSRPMEVTGDGIDRQYLAYVETSGVALTVALTTGSTVPSVGSTRTFDAVDFVTDVAVAADWTEPGTSSVVVAFAQRGWTTAASQIRYVSWRLGYSVVSGLIDSATTPNDTPPTRSRLDLRYASGIYLLAGVRTTATGATTTGEPRVYQLSRRAGTGLLDQRPVTTGLATAVHESLSVVRFSDSVPWVDRLFYNPAGNAIASMAIGCY